MSLNDVLYILRFLYFAGPIIGFIVTRRICLALQRKDREIALHGREAGVIEMTPAGEFRERHEHLSDYELYRLVGFENRRPVPAQPGKDGKVSGLEKQRAKLNKWFYEERVEPVTRDELTAARAHGHHDAVEADHGAHGIDR